MSTSEYFGYIDGYEYISTKMGMQHEIQTENDQRTPEGYASPRMTIGRVERNAEKKRWLWDAFILMDCLLLCVPILYAYELVLKAIANGTLF